MFKMSSSPVKASPKAVRQVVVGSLHRGLRHASHRLSNPSLELSKRMHRTAVYLVLEVSPKPIIWYSEVRRPRRPQHISLLRDNLSRKCCPLEVQDAASSVWCGSILLKPRAWSGVLLVPLFSGSPGPEFGHGTWGR